MSLVTVPSSINLILGALSPTRNLLVECLSYAIAPAAPPDSGGDYRFININMTACGNLAVQVLVGSVVLNGVPGGIAQTPPGACSLAFTVDVYNGYYGTNPRGFSLQVALTPLGGVPNGTVTVSAYCPGYGYAVCNINLSGGIGADFVRDIFHGVDNTPIFQHAPDYYPDAVFAGKIDGWHGKAAYGDIIFGNRLQSGGNDGQWNGGRIWCSRYDPVKVYADFVRKADPGGTHEGMALHIRVNGVAGNTDTGVEALQIWTGWKDNAHVWISAAQTRSDGSTIFIDSPFTNIAWNYGDSKRLMLIAAADKFYAFVADAGTGANPQLLYTRTLVTTYADSSHDYAGFANTHFTDCVEITEFFAGALNDVGQDPGANVESLQLVQESA